MFRATFLGHHGWLYEADDARVLVDPLLTDRFGYTDSVELRAYPPRTIDPAACPPLDAVMLTHEHEGHFNLASLALIDRRVPVYVPTRSSTAMRAILGEMGFSVRALDPGIPVTIAGLEFFPMTADQFRHAIIEEWDCIAYLVRDLSGDGSLFSSVDMQPNEGMWRLARERIARPGLWAYTNNYSDWQLLFSWGRADCHRMQAFAQRVLLRNEQLAGHWAPPAASLIIGGGFSFGGERSWLNTNVFTVDSWKTAGALSQLLPGEQWIAPVPGQTLVMRQGVLQGVEDSRFVRALPRDEWPSHDFVGSVRWLSGYAPACGRRVLTTAELSSLETELTGLAQHLYGSSLFRRLYSLTEADTRGCKPTIALVLRADDEGSAYVFEYVPQACRFQPVDCSDPAGEYLAVYECWATDLLAFLRCDLSATTLPFAYSRLWNANPGAFVFDLQHLLFEYVHPLRMPERCLTLYRRTVAALPAIAQTIPAAAAAASRASAAGTAAG